MVAKPLRTKPKSASAERCLRSLGATIDMATPDMETSNCPVRGVLSHGGLRKGNQEVAVITGFYRSPGIAGRRGARVETVVSEESRQMLRSSAQIEGDRIRRERCAKKNAWVSEQAKATDMLVTPSLHGALQGDGV